MKEPDRVYQSLQWTGNSLLIIDQTRLPHEEVYLELKTAEQVWKAIKQLSVRGAPAIGIAGAYGFYLAIKDIDETSRDVFIEQCRKKVNYLNSSRPTAVNLSWALERLMKLAEKSHHLNLSDLKDEILKDVICIHDEDRELCASIGENGVSLFGEESRILTHCNTGGLATGQFGTALSCITHAFSAGKVKKVWVDETRPLLQGARLTTWELQKAGIPHSLIVDSAAGFLMNKGEVDLVIVGADRITKSGDVANKIGTYSLSVLAKENGIPFYVAAPYSTIDLNLENGDEIEIEFREAIEVTDFNNQSSSPEGTEAFNPAFDITPHTNISAIITEKGIVYPDFKKNFKILFESSKGAG